MSLILLVDDDEDMMRLTANWLKKDGYEVALASSGRDALEFLSGSKPDLIVLDYLMPELDGPAALLAIREKEGCADIPAIFRTGAEDEVSEIADDPKFYGVVPKSEGKKSLLKKVSEILS